MLKHFRLRLALAIYRQPPSGGCVLKPHYARSEHKSQLQPPSGGCVLKRRLKNLACPFESAAAFGRLCVETVGVSLMLGGVAQPPSGGCVLKRGSLHPLGNRLIAAAFGRLCVETICSKHESLG